MSDYKKTLNLPKTSFPMRANLTQNEPKMLKYWEKEDIYNKMVAHNNENTRYVLHDGPPYANGHIHLGTAMNKILKDIIVKSKNMSGMKAEYVPGWDCHGLPIELKVEHELKEKKEEMNILAFRAKCRRYASKFLDIQRKEFKRLGSLGVWDKPYLTMHPSYEAATARELANFMAKGSVYRSKKPIYWCNSCETALAEAEVEYENHSSPSIYVRFPIKDEKLLESVPQAKGLKSYIAIWTTTPWTIPDNMAVAVHPDFDYVAVIHDQKLYILAEELLEDCAERFSWSDYSIAHRFKGSALENVQATHPFYTRPSPIVLADYVTLETGTGCVHTAPGHGREDYETGLKYDLEILSPLNDQGEFLESVEYFAGLNVFDANPEVIKVLQEHNNLLAQETIQHTYPHCWRCKKPVIFRATTQWFISMQENGLRENTLKAITNDVQWIPGWGKERIYSMIENRPDWCISRQRLWGVPIIALVCDDCGEAFFDATWAHSIVDRFETHKNGADYWFEAPIEELLPKDLQCQNCSSTSFTREDDILDVWFDSGTSFAAVVEQREECRYPADLYLEGTDQHRGWFHSSLLASMGTRNVAPYKTVLTHGFVVDGNGKKMSKSLGNVVAPQEIIDKYGAEILRIWVAAENYQEDMRISEEILKRLIDAYRRIRNTCRFILGNLNDFSPEEHLVQTQEMLSFDRYALNIILTKHESISQWFNTFEFHKVFHTLHTMCGTDLSAFYLDILKDRLYVSAPDSQERRSAQTALYHILMVLLQDMAPIMSFTAEEVFQYVPEQARQGLETVFELRHKPSREGLLSPEEQELWDNVAAVRNEVTKAIEPYRKSKEIGHSLDTHVTIYVDDPLASTLKSVGQDLANFFIVSQVTVEPYSNGPEDIFRSEDFEHLRINVSRAKGTKCQRCWIYNEVLGESPDHPEACPRCTAVLKSL